MAQPVNVNDLLDGHVSLDLECLDRIYLNAYVPNLQVSGQVVTFLTEHLGNPLPSPALFNKIGSAFRRAVAAFAEEQDIPAVRFKKGERHIEVMRPYLDRATEPGVVAIGVAQEFQQVFTGYQRADQPGAVHYAFAKADRRVSCYYFYVLDPDFGPGFVKICTYFPYPRQGVGQRPRVGQAPGVSGGHRLQRARQRVCLLRRSPAPAEHLQPLPDCAASPASAWVRTPRGRCWWPWGTTRIGSDRRPPSPCSAGRRAWRRPPDSKPAIGSTGEAIVRPTPPSTAS